MNGGEKMKYGKKIAAFAVTAAVAASGLSAFAIESTNPETNGNKSAYDTWAADWATQKLDYSSVSITPGATASELNFAWYAENAPAAKVKIATNKEMTENVKTFDENGSLTIDVSNTSLGGSTTYTKAVRVKAEGLSEKTTYYYQVSNNGSSWSDAEELKTGDTANFKMLFVGDPQIGSSGNIAHDAFNWERTLEVATRENPDLAFVLSAGDQTEHAKANSSENKDVETQYAGYLAAEALANLPVATAIGNHESSGTAYLNHFNNPNQTGQGTTTAGGDYYFSYGDALFIVLNSNNDNGAEHDAAMAAAVESHKDAKWRIVMFHHDIYGAGAPHANTDGAAKRSYLAPLMDKYNVDVCLTGHDHTYSRTYQILDGKAIDYGDTDGGTITNPQGTLYMTANSGTGSKYYDVISTSNYYVAEMSQEQVPTYSTIEMTANSFAIKTYRVENDGTATDTGDGIQIVKNVDKASLYDLIAQGEAKAAEVTAEKATPATWAALKTALVAANALLDTAADGTFDDELNLSGIVDKTKDNGQALVTAEDLNSVYTTLLSAINGLKVKGDATELNTALEAAQKLAEEAVVGSEAGNYPQAAKDALLKAIDTLKAVAANAESTQADMDLAKENLSQAVETFKASAIAENTDGNGGSSENGNENTTSSENGNGAQPSDTPKTGDAFAVTGIAVIVCMALGGTGAVLLLRRKASKR
jgi:hypothetical protein